MAHVYRAVWTDNSIYAAEVLLAEAKNWLLSRGTPVDLTVGQVAINENRLATVVEVERPRGSGIQVQVQEFFADGRSVWTTTLNALSVDSRNILWVDINAEVDGIWNRNISAPRVVTALLLAGGEPTVGIDVLEPRAVDLNSIELIEQFMDNAANPARDLSYVVIASGSGFDRLQASQRATRANEVLAGIAQVFLLDYELIHVFNSHVPEAFRLSALDGILLSPHAFEQPENSRYSYRVSAEDLGDDQRTLGVLMARRVGMTSMWVEVDDAVRRLKNALDEKRRKTLFDHDQQTVKDMSRDASPEFDSDSAAALVDLQEQLLDAWIAQEEAEQKATWYREKLVMQALEDVKQTFSKATIRAVIDEVRVNSRHIVIPQTAEKQLDYLDSLEGSASWARDLGELFGSFERYVQHRISRGFSGDYRAWCSRMGDYPDSKIAMVDSESTLRDSDLVRARTFPVNNSLDPSGKKLMIAHAKIQLRGPGYIPRVYFFDDSNGATKKIHVGFVGPHSLVPTSTF